MQDLRTHFDLRKALTGFLQEDIGSGDITSESIIPGDRVAGAHIICKTRSAVVSGLLEASMVFELCNCATKILVRDGRLVRKGKRVMEITGSARDILRAERTALNLLMRMSGIATETRQFAMLAGKSRVLATRKTAPGLRYFDKRAVVAGGGGTHRIRLDDMILIKDNHLAICGSPKDCISKARSHAGTGIKIECEVRNTKEAVEAAQSGADIVMFDNFSPPQALKTMQVLSKSGLRNRCKIEISGGVNQKNIKQYAKARPDFISLGQITHSPKAIDFSLEMDPKK